MAFRRGKLISIVIFSIRHLTKVCSTKISLRNVSAYINFWGLSQRVYWD